MRDSEFEFIRTLVYEHSRIHLGPDKRELVAARLAKRLRAVRLPDIDEYCHLLRSSGAGGELSHLIDAISTNHTSFFRENIHFEFLRTHVLPELRQRHFDERWPRLNVWSAACSSGEEPYSLAITLAEAFPPGIGWPWHIEASDISHGIIAKARMATYRPDAVAGLSAAHLGKYFDHQPDGYRVKPSLTSTVNYRQLNLLKGEPPFLDSFHVIFCRNVMIYFDRPTQEELIARLTRRLVPGGYLFVGHSESFVGLAHSLQLVKPAIYRRPPAPGP